MHGKANEAGHITGDMHCTIIMLHVNKKSTIVKSLDWANELNIYKIKCNSPLETSTCINMTNAT